jgi:hypothetical protein
MKMRAPAGLIDVRAREVARALAHFARWVDYHSGGQVEHPRRPARLSFYSSSAPAMVRGEADRSPG